MREFATHVNVPDSDNLVDIVGTGGDGSHTFNISTATMFVTAAAGAKVAKHGNRGVSSKSGSADVLEALGVNIDLHPEQVAQSIAETGMGFMFAPNHHPAMKNIAPVRRELGVRTIFNILGPLTNPAGAPNQLMGVFHEDLVVLLIDEIDRADDEFEAFLLEFLADFAVTIPELGTITAARRPDVFLTSNRTRELHDALKRRCLYQWIDYPSAELSGRSSARESRACPRRSRAGS